MSANCVKRFSYCVLDVFTKVKAETYSREGTLAYVYYQKELTIDTVSLILVRSFASAEIELKWDLALIPISEVPGERHW